MNVIIRPITLDDVNAVVDAAAKRSTIGDVQLSILSRALIASCKALGIPRHVLVREIETNWESTRPVTGVSMVRNR